MKHLYALNVNTCNRCVLCYNYKSIKQQAKRVILEESYSSTSCCSAYFDLIIYDCFRQFVLQPWLHLVNLLSNQPSVKYAQVIIFVVFVTTPLGLSSCNKLREGRVGQHYLWQCWHFWWPYYKNNAGCSNLYCDLSWWCFLMAISLHKDRKPQ